MNFYMMLTEAERNAVQVKAARIRWGFSPKSIRSEFKRWKNGNDKEKAKVLYLLEDCNYHTLCGLLEKGDEAGAVAWMDAEMPLDD